MVSRVTEKGDAFVRMRLDRHGTSMIQRAVPLDPAWKSVAVSWCLRANDVKPGDKDYETPVVQVIFRNATGEHVGGWLAKLKVGKDADWHEQQQRYVVPEGAASVVLQIFMLDCAGTFDVD